ncbi:decarboxylating 6-phosphogluconate dehydrogenase [Candidatus Woesearchaeota archaeon]|nr:decarboxylating 6-phosphogluconate dehydrogenase [Candidatus Woesearchaeota archaeon]
MRLGFIGLGRMGHNVVLNLMDKGHGVVAYNRSPGKVRGVVKKGAIGAYSVAELVQKLQKPRVIILMVTAGSPVDAVLQQLLPLLSKGDAIIEAGNSWFEDSVRRYSLCKKKSVNFIDMGTSGGLAGARHGASLTIGGDKHVFRKYEKLFRDIAAKDGYAYVGSSGAGHFVKMVHNGIEYALEEAYAEGFELLNKSRYRLNLEKIAKVWSRGSIIRSYLSELAESVFRKDANLKKFRGSIGGGETGAWTLKVANREKVEMQTLAHALKIRKQSLKKQTFATKFVSALRAEFGGHKEAK